MPGSDNRVQYSNGYRLESSAAEEIFLMQKTSTDVSMVNNAGSPEGVVSANPGSVCFDNVDGLIFLKNTGTGNTGWVQLSTVNDDLHTAKFIVSSEPNVGGQYTTISAAITAAATSGLNSTIFIMPGLTGVYTEDFTLPANVNLSAYTCDALTPNVTIVGKITITAAGSNSISGIRLQSNTSNFLSVTGTNAIIINLINCDLICNTASTAGISNQNSLSNINIMNCMGNIANSSAFYFVNTGIMQIKYCQLFNTSGSVATNSLNGTGSLTVSYSRFISNITLNDSTGAFFSYTFIDLNTNTTIVTNNSTAGVSDFSAYNTVFASSTASAFALNTGSTTVLHNCVINSSNGNVITGAGSLTYSDLSFGGTSAHISAGVQILNVSNNVLKTTSTSGPVYDVVSIDQCLYVNTLSNAVTINLPDTPSYYQIFTIKDSQGNALNNNITITTLSGIDTIDGSTSVLIDQNYGSIQVQFNGVNYVVLSQSSPPVTTTDVQFVTTLETTVSSVTGDGTPYTIIFDSVKSNIGSTYDSTTGLTTVPIDGNYLFTCTVYMTGVDATNTDIIIRFLTPSMENRFFVETAVGNYNSSGILSATGSCIFNLTATETVQVQLLVDGVSKNISLLGDTDSYFNTFSGILLK